MTWLRSRISWRRATSSIRPGSQASNLNNNYPSVDIPVDDYTNGSNSGASTSYIQLSRATSMATPFATATVALMPAANPALTPDQVKAD